MNRNHDALGIARRPYENNPTITSMMSAFSKPPVLAPSAPKPQSYEMPRRQQEYFSSDRRDERDVKITEVQLSYSQALDEVDTQVQRYNALSVQGDTSG